MDIVENQTSKYLIFSVDGHTYSVDFKNVRQIVPAEMPERIPDFPDYVLGTFKYDKKYVPVIALAIRFGYDFDGMREHDCFIITNDTEKQAALLVNDIYGFAEVTEEMIQPAVELNEQASARFLVGEFTDSEGRECRIIDPVKVIRLGDEGIFEQGKE